MNAPFQIAVRSQFSFLEGRGFDVVVEGSASIRYESAKAFVVIDRDWRSGEMNVLFGLKAERGAKEDTFSLTDLLKMEQVSSPLATRPYEVYSDKGLAPFVEEMAKASEIYASSALDGDQAYFQRLSAFRREPRGKNN